MNKLLQILEMRPTESEHMSQQIVIECLQRENWRTYSSRTCTTANIEDIITRYLEYHARVPGFLTANVYATEPAAVFGWKDEEGVTYKGGVYKNGVVMVADQPNGERVLTLFIDEADAEQWLYPDEENYQLLGKKIREQK